MKDNIDGNKPSELASNALAQGQSILKDLGYESPQDAMKDSNPAVAKLAKSFDAGMKGGSMDMGDVSEAVGSLQEQMQDDDSELRERIASLESELANRDGDFAESPSQGSFGIHGVDESAQLHTLRGILGQDRAGQVPTPRLTDSPISRIMQVTEPTTAADRAGKGESVQDAYKREAELERSAVKEATERQMRDLGVDASTAKDLAIDEVAGRNYNADTAKIDSARTTNANIDAENAKIDSFNEKLEDKKAKEAEKVSNKKDKEESDKIKQEKLDADKEVIESTKNVTKGLDLMANNLKMLADTLREGANSANTNAAAAAYSGMSAADQRAVQDMLTEGGNLSENDSQAVLYQSGEQQLTFNDTLKGNRLRQDWILSRATSNLDSVKNMDIKSYAELREMSPKEILAYQMDEINKYDDPEDRQGVAAVFNQRELAYSDITGDDIRNAEADPKDARDADQSIKVFDHFVRDLKESLTGFMGGGAGIAVGAVSVGGTLASILAINTAILAKIGKGVGGGSDKGRNPSTSTPESGEGKDGKDGKKPKPSKLGKLGKFGMFSSALYGLSIAPDMSPIKWGRAEGRDDRPSFFGVKSEGEPMIDLDLPPIPKKPGVLDVWDEIKEVSQLANDGSSKPDGVNPYGTREHKTTTPYSYLTPNPDINLPSANIDASQSMPQAPATTVELKDKQSVNVSVTNEISPDLIRTETDINGDVSESWDSGYSTIGR